MGILSYSERRQSRSVWGRGSIWVAGAPPREQADRAKESWGQRCLPQTATRKAAQGSRKLRDVNPTHLSAQSLCLPCVLFARLFLFPSSLPSRSLTPSCSATDQLNEDIMTTTGAGRIQLRPLLLALAICVLLFCADVHASIGDRLPEFRQCVEVCDHPDRDGDTIQPWKRVGADRTVRRSARRRIATRISRRLRSVRHAPDSPFGSKHASRLTLLNLSDSSPPPPPPLGLPPGMRPRLPAHNHGGARVGRPTRGAVLRKMAVPAPSGHAGAAVGAL